MQFVVRCLVAPRDETKPRPSRLTAMLVLALALGWGSVISAQDSSPRPPEPPLPVLEIPPRPPEPPLPVDAVFAKSGPSSVDDLRLIQNHVRELAKKVVAATVGLRIGGAQGSGVIISDDGYVLTAGHVSGAPKRNVLVILPDGRFVKGKTLGANHGIDSGLIKITDKNPDGGDWYHVNIGESKTLTAGTWCLCTGHPGGYKRGRPPVVRLGRILASRKGEIVSDCTMVGGDSGGPLFNMDGDVIGINSRIGGPLTANIHVPVDTFPATWDRLVNADEWGQRRGQSRQARPGGPFLGVGGVPQGECKITQVSPDSPAAKAGIKIGDIVKKFGGKDVKSFSQLVEMVGKKKPKDKVTVELIRDGKTITVELQIGKRPG